MKEALEQAIIYIERRGAAVEDAVTTLWPDIGPRLTAEERDRLAQRGFNSAVHAALTRQRYEGPDVEQITVRQDTTQAPKQVAVRVTMWERVRYETADGGTAPIIKFLTTDWDALKQNQTATGRGAFRVARFAGKMIRTHKEHGVDRTADLPGDVLAELAATSPWATD